jgi:poly(A) polymerase
MTGSFAWLEWPETQALAAVFPAGSLRFVGGAVRDGLLGRPVHDVDAATTLSPDEVMAVLHSAQIRTIPTGIDHGTVTARINERSIEITTLRRDEHTDGRHAQVAFTSNWEEDAARRDFTMNALYLSPQGELFDYTGGVADAKAGHVRFIGDSQKRIAEDYLRILRFFRFFAHYGSGKADAQALAACTQARGELAGLSGERIQHEMWRLLQATAPLSALQAMAASGVLAQLFGQEITSATVQAVGQLPAEPLVRLSALLAAEGAKGVEQLATRWRLSGHQRKALLAHVQLVERWSVAWSPAVHKQEIRSVGAVCFLAAAHIRAALYGEDTKAAQALAQSWQVPEFPLRGADLLAAGVEEGKALGIQLQALETAWEASDYTLAKDQLLALIKR